ncbi:hypothetical protein IMZ48_02995 [Candidatus Bathyarchaeota archaeon]|nr:hypothetical protein [Candidatus Bathyarchaeota archaeon]
MKLTLIVTSLLATALASPLASRQADAFTHEGDWTALQITTTPAFPIHESCNATLSAQLSRALDETAVLARHAKEHLLRWGGTSPIVQKYFGNGTTSTPIGWYERIVSADRGSIVFRCDDPDGNCASQNGK